MRVVSIRVGVVVSLCCWVLRPVYGQDPAGAAIPDSLRQGASVVERVNEMEIDIELLT